MKPFTIKSFFWDSFKEGLLWLPARLTVGVPIIFMACLLAEIDLGSWGRIKAVGDGWWRSLHVRLLFFVPLFFLFFVVSRISYKKRHEAV